MRTEGSPVITMNRRRTRGVSILEAVVTMGVIGTISALLAHSFSSNTELADNQASALRLATSQVAARQVASTNGYRYPTTVRTDMRSPGLSFVDSSSSTSTEVSVRRLDEQTLLLVLRDSVGCTVLVDSVTRPAVWGRDDELSSGDCSAAVALPHVGTIFSTKYEDPTPIELG